MKKLLLLMVACMAICFTSCKGVPPEFKFDFAISGEVSDAKTNIIAVLDNTVTNMDKALMIKAAITQDVSVDQQNDAYSFLNTFIEQNIISAMPPETVYTIIVKGVVYETVTGVSIGVDKTFTNKPSN